MSTPRTSIIMPVYNTGTRVVASIESVLAQTDTDFELLVMIDASPDDASARIADFLAAHPDERVRVFDNPVNKGVSAVRNQGLDNMRGQWVAFLDSDDAFAPDFLATMHAAAGADSGAENIDVVACAHTLIEAGGKNRERRRGEPGVYSGDEALTTLLKDKFTPYVWDKIFRASLFKNLRFPEDIHRAEDQVVVAGAYAQARSVKLIKNALYNYTVDAGGLTWGKITPVAESRALMAHMKDAAGAVVQTAEGKRAYDVSWVLTFLNTAQQALVAGTEEGNRVIKQCRREISWAQILNVFRAPSVVFGAAAVLLKVSPALYKKLYGAYIKKMYGI